MSDSVYKIIELIGTSETSWEQGASNALEQARKEMDDLRIAEVAMQDLKLEDGKVVAYRTKIRVSYKFADQDLAEH